MNHTTTPEAAAQERVTAAADALAALGDHLERYTNTMPGTFARHLSGKKHTMDLTPAQAEDRVTMHALHQQAHLPALVAAGAELDAAQAALTGSE